MEIKLFKKKIKEYFYDYILLLWFWGFKIIKQPSSINGEYFYDCETIFPKRKKHDYIDRKLKEIE